jgi:hypothetical protein
LKVFNYKQFIDNQTLEINLPIFVKSVKNCSQRHDIGDAVLLGGLDTIESLNLPAWDICTGDDVLGVLSVGLRRALGNNDANAVDDTQLRRALRLAYSETEFLSSDLARSFKEWEAANPSYHILKHE